MGAMRVQKLFQNGFLMLSLLAPAFGCGGPAAEDDGANPFADSAFDNGKEDTGYQNPDGVEVEVDLEGDVDAPAYNKSDAPAVAGQFALSYFRKRGEFYIESLAEDASSDKRVEWLVDGKWITAEAAKAQPPEKLVHFRIKAVNAVMLHEARKDATVGKVFVAPVPKRPFSIQSDAGDKCAEKDDHMPLSQSIYWYLWDPSLPTCTVDKTDLKVTVSKLSVKPLTTYPEYDRLIADKKLTVVVLFGLIGDELSASDSGVTGAARMASNLKRAGFVEVPNAPIGKRLSKLTSKGTTIEVDLYSPYEFEGLGDWNHFANLEKAIAEHEIVAYDGHSMLGASDYWSRPKYPGFYQIFLYGGCLGYEYYVRPIVGGKGGWQNVDIMSSVIEVSAGANEFAAPALSRIFSAIDKNGAGGSWTSILTGVRRSVGDSTFGVSGVRENCFSPSGNRCAH